MSTPDVVFIVREHPARDEFQYALRSLQNVPHGTVWLLGGRPEWIRNVRHVPWKDGGDKWKNIAEKFKSLATLDGLSEEFIYTEDDYFILKPHDRLPDLSYPTSLNEYVDARLKRKKRPSGWTLYLKNTRDALHELGIEDPVSFDVHVPMYVRKSLIPLHWEPGMPVSWRSLTGNFDGRTHTPITTDVKVTSAGKLRGAIQTGFLSSNETTFQKTGVKTTLQKLFPEHCVYEKEYTGAHDFESSSYPIGDDS